MHQNTFSTGTGIGVRSKAISVGMAVLLVLATVLLTVPPAFAVTATAKVSPSSVDAKASNDLTFTVTNPAASTANIVQVQILVSVRWALIEASAVTPSGLGGSPSVSVSGSGPYVVVVSGIALAPSASGTVKLAGMVADVGTAGTTYTDTFTVRTLDSSTGATLTDATVDPSGTLTVSVNVPSGVATRMEFGVEPKATFDAPTLTTADKLKVAVTATAGASTGATVTFIVVGTDAAGSTIVGSTSIAQGSAVAFTSGTIKAFGTSTDLTYKTVSAVYIRHDKDAGVVGDKYKIITDTAGATVVSGIEARDSTSGSIVAGQALNVAAYVTDNTGKGISGATVSFSTSGLTPAGSFSPSSITTDTTGAAKTVYSTSTKQGIQTLKASSSGLLGSGTSVKLTTVWGGAASLSVSASPSSISVVGGISTITAKILDANGNTRMVGGVTVTFATSAGSLSATSATTDASGVATITLTPVSTTKPGSTAVVTASAAGLTGQVTISFTSGAVASISVSVSKSTIKILETTTVTATVKDANGNTIQGAAVTFSQTITGGLATYTPSLSPSSGTTGADGTVSTTVTASIESGTLTVTATSAGFSATTGTITISGGEKSTLVGSASASTIKADGASTTALTFKFQDRFGNDVTVASDTTVTLSTTGGTLSATSTKIAAGTTTSTAVTLTSSTTVGAVTVSASAAGLSTTVKVTFAGAATSFTLSASPSTVSTGGTSTITITLVDANGVSAINSGGVVTTHTQSALAGTVSAPTAIAPGGTSTTFTYTAPATVPAGATDTITVTVTIPGPSGSSVTVTKQISVTIAGVVKSMVVTADLTAPPADGTTIVKLTMKQVDAAGVTVIPSAPIPVTISTTGGKLLTTTATISATTGEATGFIQAPSTVGSVTITVVGGGTIGTLTLQFGAPPPVYKEATTTPALQDTAGNPVTAPKVGTLVTVTSTITNNQDTAQTTLYIVQVKDSAGAVVYLSFVSGTIPANTALQFGVGWTPTAPGRYTIEVFAWDGFATANVLATTQSTTVTVT